jgi:hypothetical protein
MLEQLFDSHREFKPKTEMVINIVTKLFPHFPDDIVNRIFEINIQQYFF